MLKTPPGYKEVPFNLADQDLWVMSRKILVSVVDGFMKDSKTPPELISAMMFVLARSATFDKMLEFLNAFKKALPFHVFGDPATDPDPGVLKDDYVFQIAEMRITAGEIRQLDAILTEAQGTPYPKADKPHQDSQGCPTEKTS